MPANMMELESGTYWVKNGILHLEFNSNADGSFSMEDTDEHVYCINNIYNNHDAPFMIDIRKIESSISAQEMINIIKYGQESDHVGPRAILTDEFPVKLLSKFYHSNVEYPAPIAFFSDYKVAEKWLNKFRSN